VGVYTKVGNQLIHPDKVYNVSYLMASFCMKYSRLGAYRPFIIIAGIGTKECEYRDRPAKREMHHIIEYCRIKGLPLSNIIGIDIDNDVISEWGNSGITLIKGTWARDLVFREARRTIQELSCSQQRCPKILLYANTRGCEKDIIRYKTMVDIVKPQIFAGLYSTRPYGLNYEFVSIEGYNNKDIGLRINKGKYNLDGSIVYNAGTFLRVFEKEKKGVNNG
jgi:hypothetical protein